MPTGFTHLHTHSEFSALDGYSTMKEIVGKVKLDGATAVGIADHGVCAGHPELQKVADEAGIKPIFGMEAYFVEDRHDKRTGSDDNRFDYWHIVLFAMNEQGLKNLWAISTEGYREGLHRYPKVDWDTLERLGEGIIATTACLRGPVTQPYLAGKQTKALANLSHLKRIFGDRLYIEIHANQLEDQKKANRWLVRQSVDFEIPLVAAADSHYATKEDKKAHRVWLGVSTGRELNDDSSLFGGDQDYHLMTEAEVRYHLDYLDRELVNYAVENTGVIADRCNVRIEGRQVMPVFSRTTDEHPDPVQHDIDRMLEMCADNWERRTVGKTHTQEEYFARFEREVKLLIKKGFPGYFLMVADLVNYAKDNGVLVGPGRGSGGGSLVAYLMGITEIDPVEYDLLFERFMTDGRVSLPDFDIDFPSSRKQFMIDYARTRWGRDHVSGVGTHLRLKNKGAFRNVAQAIHSELPENYVPKLDAISAIIKDAEASTAGLGLKWDELFDVVGDQLEPYREELPQLFHYAEKMRSRLKTFSRHAAGLIIDPDRSLVDELPMFAESDSEELVTQFDLAALEPLGFIKFDLLNLRNLDTIQDAVDLIKQRDGIIIDVNSFNEELKDSKVFDEISAGWTLGVFQIETNSGTRLTKRFKPKSILELADVITLVRPGPMNSGLTESYLKRKAGEEDTTYADERMRSILEMTQGAMIYQEQVMALCIELAAYDSNKADEVRKILGKKKVDEAKLAGVEFIEKAVANETDVRVATELWAQMEEFSRYSFGKAHAVAYAILAFWTAWLKVHHSLCYMTAALSTVKMERIPDFVAETRRLGYRVLPPDINESGRGFTAAPTSVRYGLESIKGIGRVTADSIMAGQPYRDYDDFIERRGEKCNLGDVRLLAHVGALDSLGINRRAVEKRLDEAKQPPRTQCVFFALENDNHGLPCKFDWDNEPREIGRTGKPLKAKPLPKKCSRACRGFTQKEPIRDEDVVPYTDAEIRAIEVEALGIYLSSSPFDMYDQNALAELSTGYEILSGPNGRYYTAVIITRVKNHTARNGSVMAFLGATTPGGDLDMTVFSEQRRSYLSYLKPGQMGVVEVSKNDRGITMNLFNPLD